MPLRGTRSDFTFAALPERLAQQVLLDLADRRLREVFDDPHQPRPLELGEIALTALDDRFGVEPVSYTHLTLPTIYSV